MNISFYVDGVYCGNKTNLTNGTWCICMCALWMSHYNTTYYWYVNVTEFGNTSNYNQSETYHFTTALTSWDCEISSTGTGNERSYVIGLIGILGILGILGYFMKKRRR